MAPIDRAPLENRNEPPPSAHAGHDDVDWVRRLQNSWQGCTTQGGRVFVSWGGGGIQPSGRSPPKKGSIDMTPKILQRLTPGPRRWPRPKNEKTKKMGFLESACRGDSEKSSFAIYLVKKNRPILMLKKSFRHLCRQTSQGLINGAYQLSPFPEPPVLGGSIEPPPRK